MSRTGSERIALLEAGPTDVPVIAALHCECFTDGLGGAVWSAASIAKVLSLAGSYAYLASMAGAEDAGPKPAGPAPAGFVLARALAGECEILSLGVAADWRRRGVARALLRVAMDRAGEAGATRTLLEVAEDNEAARALYGAEGFTLVNRRPGYYSRPCGVRAAALVFARDLGQGAALDAG